MLDVGFIRYRHGLVAGFDLQNAEPAPPGSPDPDYPAMEYDHNRHLYADYVADAHAIQVLTKAHLDRANDLSAWDIDSLGNDRYLVQARELEPWFDREPTEIYGVPWPVPDPDVLDRARRDFGAMILTHDVLQADPRAWIKGRSQEWRFDRYPNPVWNPRSRRR